PNLCTMVWIPLVFLALDGYARDRSLGWIGLGIGAFALQILAGHIQYFYYTVLVAGLYVLAQLPRAQRKVSYLVGPAAMLGGACLLTAVQLMAGWEATQESIRGQALPLNLILSNDLMPERVWSWWAPFFYGDDLHHNYWGGGMYWEGSLFVSVTGIALAFYGFFASRAPKRKLVAGLGIFIILLAMGKRTPLFLIFYHWMPLFGDFRGAAKLNILITLWVCFLAAAGLDHYLKNESQSRGLIRWTGGFALGVSALAALFYYAPVLGLGRLFGKFGSHASEMVKNIFICSLMLGLVTLVAWAGKRQSSLRFGLLALAFLELFFFARANRGGFDLPTLEKKAAGIQAVYDHQPGDYRVTAEPSNIVLGTQGFDVWGNDPMIPGRYALFLAASQKEDAGSHFVDKPFFRNYPKVLGMTRLRYIFTPQGDGWKIKKTNFREQARVSLISDWRIALGHSALKQLADPRFNFRKKVLLESDPGFASTPRKPQGLVQWKDISTDQMEIEAENSKPCVLVVSDNYAKGWRVKAASDDTQKIYRVMPANFFQRGIPLKAGHHHFILEYLPRSFVLGKWISIVSLIFFAVLGLVWMTRRRWSIFRKKD
ncbi:MAG: hypothetical protein ACREL1_05960, partial [bacterium]